MWRLGDLSIGGPVVLGPMSGYTSAAYREFMRPFGVSMAYTEMVSDQGLKYGGRQTMSFLDFRSEGITGVQLFGHVPDDLLSAAEKALEINDSLAFVDINMGCPVPKVNRTGAGSALMKDPALCGDIVRRLKRNLSIPVTVKIRLGWTGSTANFMDVIREVESAGVDAVCIHPRTRDERYTGKPHYDLVEGLRDEMSVPLIISGNIYSLDDAINARRTTGAEAVMLARGGIGNPFLVTQIDRYFRYGERLPNPTVRRQAELCLQLADM
ncbi:MAG: tRNA-dihydrouridine synthase family protein, partial [Candidatus Methanomethylophilus sp.]|nr:tRNA-dihydrouridine synthase family protein [Methanomethylophilus sp.]